MSIYNLKNRKNQRKIELEAVAGNTYSTTSDEFVMHCPSEYDYRFASSMKVALIE
jgi:hypothetical protein